MYFRAFALASALREFVCDRFCMHLQAWTVIEKFIHFLALCCRELTVDISYCVLFISLWLKWRYINRCTCKPTFGSKVIFPLNPPSLLNLDLHSMYCCTGWISYGHATVWVTLSRGKPLRQTVFLGATKHLYNWLCPLVGRSVCW